MINVIPRSNIVLEFCLGNPAPTVLLSLYFIQTESYSCWKYHIKTCFLFCWTKLLYCLSHSLGDGSEYIFQCKDEVSVKALSNNNESLLTVIALDDHFDTNLTIDECSEPGLLTELKQRFPNNIEQMCLFWSRAKVSVHGLIGVIGHDSTVVDAFKMNVL